MEIKDQTFNVVEPAANSPLSLEALATKLSNHKHTEIDGTKKLATATSSTIAVGSGTKSAAGTLAIVCGFTPKVVKITAIVNQTGARAQSIGFATPDLPNGFCSVVYGDGAGYTLKTDNLSSNLIFLNNNTGSDYAQAVISTFNADGFTLNFTSCTGAVYFNWEAYG